MNHPHRRRIVPKRFAGMGCRMQDHLLRRAIGHHSPTAVPTFRTQVNQPVSSADHVQVVLNHHQRMPGIHQLAQRTHQFGNIVKVQAGSGLIQHKERSALRRGLAADRAALGCFRQKARQLEALRLAARKRRHRLPQLHVFQPDIDNGLQHPQHITVVREKSHCFAHREVQDICHVELPSHGIASHTPLNRNFQYFGPVTLPIAVRATQVNVAQKLHLYVLKTGAAAGGATAITAVKAELAGRVAALFGEWRGSKNLPQGIPRAHIAHGVGARGFANG